jgi:hypothetical protein
MALAGIAEHAGVGRDQRIHAHVGGLIHGALPAIPAVRLGIGVDGDIQLPALLADQLQTLVELLFIEIEAGEMAGVGVVAPADLNGIGALLDGGLERGQASCRADQVHDNS